MSASAAPASPGVTRWGWLLASFTRREILNRYAGSATGLAWTLLHPLAQLAIFAFVFSHVFRVPMPEGYPGTGYVTFVAVALWPWIMFSEGMARAMTSITGNAVLIRKVAFPHALVVFAGMLATVAVHAVGFVVVLVALRLVGEPVRLLALPLAVVVLIPYLLLATGVGAFLAALQTLLRDVEHGYQVAITILFYASPILYPVSLIPEAYRRAFQANPVAWFSERLREVLLQGAGLVWGDALALAGSLLALAAGLWFFNRLSPYFEDFL